MTDAALFPELTEQLRAQIATHADSEVEQLPEPVMGFGLSAAKVEGRAIKHDRLAPFNFADHFAGRVTRTRMMRLLKKADAEIRRAAGFGKWDRVFWRVPPVFEQERDFERDTVRTILRFRGSFVDE